jgi:hypothetical protein
MMMIMMMIIMIIIIIIILIIIIIIIISLTEFNSGTIQKLAHFDFIVRISSKIKQLHLIITASSGVCFD